MFFNAALLNNVVADLSAGTFDPHLALAGADRPRIQSRQVPSNGPAS